MAWYLKTGQAETLGQLTAHELKRYLGELRDRDLADNTIHGFSRYSEHSRAGRIGRVTPSIRHCFACEHPRLLRRRWRPTRRSR
jgi:hypothetical protein